jgi:F-type H+-transporting ATPase subunit epsilon
MTLLQVDIVTPQNAAYQGMAQAVTLPGALSPFQVLVNHAPIISALELGPIKVVDEAGNELYFATTGGFAEVKNNSVSIVVETAESADGIDVERARKALARAQQQLENETNLGLRAVEKANSARALNRLKVVELSGRAV